MRYAEICSGAPSTEKYLFCPFNRCQEVGSEERQKEKREEKCPFLENSGSEEGVLQILQYMATILGTYVKISVHVSFYTYRCPLVLVLFVHVCVGT